MSGNTRILTPLTYKYHHHNDHNHDHTHEKPCFVHHEMKELYTEIEKEIFPELETLFSEVKTQMRFVTLKKGSYMVLKTNEGMIELRNGTYKMPQINIYATPIMYTQNNIIFEEANMFFLLVYLEKDMNLIDLFVIQEQWFNYKINICGINLEYVSHSFMHDFISKAKDRMHQLAKTKNNFPTESVGKNYWTDKIINTWLKIYLGDETVSIYNPPHTFSVWVHKKLHMDGYIISKERKKRYESLYIRLYDGCCRLADICYEKMVVDIGVDSLFVLKL